MKKINLLFGSLLLLWLTTFVATSCRNLHQHSNNITIIQQPSAIPKPPISATTQHTIHSPKQMHAFN